MHAEERKYSRPSWSPQSLGSNKPSRKVAVTSGGWEGIVMKRSRPRIPSQDNEQVLSPRGRNLFNRSQVLQREEEDGRERVEAV